MTLSPSPYPVKPNCLAATTCGVYTRDHHQQPVANRIRLIITLPPARPEDRGSTELGTSGAPVRERTPVRVITGDGGWDTAVIFDPPPRSRRRAVARILWPTLIAIALIVAVVVSTAGEQTRLELEYLDEMRAQATELSRSGSAVANIMSRLEDIDRDEFTTLMGGVEDDLVVALAFVAEKPPTESLIPVWALYRQAVQAWSNGIAELSTAILAAADDPENSEVVNATGDALAELRAGDAVFADLRSEFERDEVPEPVGPLAVVRLTPNQDDLFSLAHSYVSAARRSANGLGLRPGLKLSQVVSDPAMQIDVENQAVIPATETVAFTTVVTNSGNIASQPESVRLELVGGAEPVVETVEVPPLQPDRQTTITFPDLELVPETLYEVTVRLDLTHPDADMTDNEMRVQFRVNAS